MENTTEQVVTQETTQQPTEQIQTSTPETVVEVQDTQTETPTTETSVEQEIQPFELPTQEQQQEELTPETVASKFDKQVLLKALGYKGHALKVLDLLNTPEGLAEYAKVMSVDYDKIPDEKIIEAKLREQYASSGLSEEELNLLIEDELKSRYKQDTEEYTERDVQLGKIRLKTEAAAHRQSLKTKQGEWKWETQPVQVETPEQIAEKQKAAFEQARNMVLSDEAIKPILSSKAVKFGEYNHNLTNPQETIAMLYDNNRYLYNVAKKDAEGKLIMQGGQPVLDYSKLVKLAAYAQDMDNIEKGLIALGEAKGKKELIDKDENIPDLTKGASADSKPDDVWQALNRKLMQQ